MISAKDVMVLGLGALLAGLVSTAAIAEDGFKPDSAKNVPCPHPSEVTLVLRAPSAVQADFPGAPPPVLAGLNDPSPNKPFRHTFSWTEPKEFCCEIISARLKVGLVANRDQPENDSIGIYSQNGPTGMGGYIYGGSANLPGNPAPAHVAPGTAKTIIWPINAATLATMNQNHRLSFGVQDDSAVTGADLTILACCVHHYG